MGIEPMARKLARAKRGTSKAAREARIRLFAEAYVANGHNATRAAIAAGYTAKSAGRQGLRLTKDVYAIAEIERRESAALAKFEINTENVLKELAGIVYFDPAKCFDEKGVLKPLHEIDERTRRALVSIKDGEAKGHDKTPALRTAMQYLRLLPGSGVNVQTNVQSVASAEANTGQTEERSILDIARRIAFTLTLGAETSGQ